jgi:hypothetical protein
MSVYMLTQHEAQVLRALLARADEQPAAIVPEEPPELSPGDVAQIRPFADSTFGGMLAVITKAEPYELRGYLLRPHRGGCRQAWLRLKHCELTRVGRAVWPADKTDFALRCEGQGPKCARS